MQWRRGLLFAGIHLAIGGTVVVWHGKSIWTDSPPLVSHQLVPHQSGAKYQVVALQEEEQQTVGFNPCDGGFVDGYGPPDEAIVEAADFPAWLLSEWGGRCPSQSGLAGKIEAHFGRGSVLADAIGAGVFCAAIPILWFFVGAFPLRRPRRWWGEPGAFVTACTVFSSPFLLVLSLDRTTLGNIPAEISKSLVGLLTLSITLGWVWWFGLLLGRIVKVCWGLMSRRAAPSA